MGNRLYYIYFYLAKVNNKHNLWVIASIIFIIIKIFSPIESPSSYPKIPSSHSNKIR